MYVLCTLSLKFEPPPSSTVLPTVRASMKLLPKQASTTLVKGLP